MANSGDMPMGGRSTLRPPRGAITGESALDAGSVVKSQGKKTPEPGALATSSGGTGNSMSVGGGVKKGQGPRSLQT